VFVSDEDENKQPRRHWPIPEKRKAASPAAPIDRSTNETTNMRRPHSTTGAKFTVRGQVYIQTSAFFHSMSNDREVRIIELATTCPECSEPFQATASMRQIKTRQLVRRCPACREIHFGPVKMPPAPQKPAARKSKRKATPGRKRRKVRSRQAVVPTPLRSALPTPVALTPAPTHAREPFQDGYRAHLAMLD
jgi:hypothetical protein